MMRAICLVIFLWSGLGFAQDTLIQTNSNSFGFSQTYVLNEDGTFKYWSKCHCTGVEDRGVGRYVISRRKLVFEFDSLSKPQSSAICINPTPADSVSLNVYDASDSTQLDFFSAKDSVGYWLSSENNKIPSSNIAFDVFWFYTDDITILPGTGCSAYNIYLNRRFDTINKGTVHELRIKKGGYESVERIRRQFPNRRKPKSTYKFRLKSTNS